MKRLISLFLCATMLVGMVVTAVSADYVSDGSYITITDTVSVGGEGLTMTTTGNGEAYTQLSLRENVSNSTVITTDTTGRSFALFFAVYFTSYDSAASNAFFGGGTQNGMFTAYDFIRKEFVIANNANFIGYNKDNGSIVANKSYELKMNTWYVMGFRYTGSVVEIILNGEVMCSYNYSGHSGWYIFCPKNCNAYLDNYQLFQSDVNIAYTQGSSFKTFNSSKYFPAGAGIAYNESVPSATFGVDSTMALLKEAHEYGADDVEYSNEWLAKMQAAEAAYDNMTPAQQEKAVAYGYALVKNEAYEKYNALKSEAESGAVNQAAANEVIAKISAIGTVTYTDVSKAKIDAAKSAYNALTEVQKALVTNYSTLTAAETTYANLKAAADANKAAADAVISKISAIGTVTYTDVSKAKIDAARSAYNALTEVQKALVTNYSTLTTAETTYANLKAEADANKAAADDVISKINAIGEVSYTTLSKNMIDAARSAYNALTAAQKDLVTNYNTLTAAESTYNELKIAAENQAKADEVIAKINAIGDVTLDDADAVASARDAYTALSAAQQALVTNYNTLTDAETRIAELNAAKAAADAVVAKINAIGTVTLESGDAIIAAENAYAALSDDAKAFVTNYSTLTTARSEYNGLVVSDFNTRATAELRDVSIANKADLEALVAEYNELRAAGLSPTASILPRLNSTISRISGYETAVQNVEDLIDAIGNVTVDSGAAIEAAESAYAALTTQEQKDLVTNYQALLNAREAYDALLSGDEITNASAVNKVRATSLTISDSLAINYKITVDPAYEIVGMEFTLAGNNTVVTYYTTDANGYLVFKFDNIAPDMMAETITSVIIVKNGDGDVIRCEPAEYSIAKYANNKIATEGLTELLASMVNYGDAASAYTGTYTKPSTVIKDWSVYADSAVAVRDYTSIQSIGTEIDDTSVTWGSASLILGDSVDIRIKVVGAVGSGYVAKTVYGGEEVTFDVVTEYGESYFVWDIYNAAQMSVPVTFTIYDADGNAVSNTLTYSVESYVADMLAETDDEKLVNLLTAMMQYGDAALAYKNAANG